MNYKCMPKLVYDYQQDKHSLTKGKMEGPTLMKTKQAWHVATTPDVHGNLDVWRYVTICVITCTVLLLYY